MRTNRESPIEPDERTNGSGRRGAPQAEAWLELYEELGERVFRLAHRMTGDEDVARDMAHDTFVLAFERMDQYDGRGPLSTWIFRIAGNLVRERARTGRRRAELLALESHETRRSVRDDSGRVETRLVLEEALEGLPEALRATLLLYEVDGYSHAEIGEMMGVAEGSSRARLARAKAEVREALKGKV